MHLDTLASQASLSDAASYGAGLRKFHLFCDIFSVPESARLPASLPVLKSFALWAITDPDPDDPVLADGTPFEPVSVVAVHRIQANRRRRPPRPPVTLHMLTTLRSALRLNDPFDAAVWAAATCSFWGMMRFGESHRRSSALQVAGNPSHTKRTSEPLRTLLHGTWQTWSSNSLKAARRLIRWVRGP
ncbi:hypothetical protein BC629DRAFT_811723 [Irpex lacteus]|nr:hypothetical protein BC629DRAFT_811723 [Irpex lacteus]